MKIILFAVLVGVFEHFAYGFVPTSELFPYGPANGDTQLPIADDNFVNVTLILGNVFNFFNSSYSSLFVNNNGAISFIEGVSQFTPTCGPLSVPMIVPFWADVDTRNGGTVNYRETTTRSILLKASDEIRRGFPSFININLGWSFIITWDNVAFYGATEGTDCRGTDKRNIFQAILSTDGSKSFVIFFYNTITWTTGTASSGNNCSGLGGTPAKAGFDVGDGKTFYEIAGTCTDAIVNISETTNVGQAGKWIFRIDNELQSAGCLRSEQAALTQLTISPSFISIFGNNPITIRGPCMVDVIRLRCRFNDVSPKTVDAVVSSENVASCVVPYLYTNGRIKVDLLVGRANGIEETFSGYIYTVKPAHELRFDLVRTSEFRLSWDAANFGGRTQTLDLELVEFAGGVWTSRGVIKEYLLNTGSYSGPLNSQGVTVFTNLRNVYVVKLRSSSQVGRSVATINDNTNSIFSDILYSLVNKTETELDELCNGWYIVDEGAPTDALPCPPFVSQARVDERFEVVDDLLTYNPGADIGYRQRVPSASGAGQRCTYRNGAIIVGPPSGGNVRSVSPNGNFGVVRHATADIAPWYFCCKLTTNAANCRKYYERRPSDSGINYVPPVPTTVIGDPHIITYDRVSYTFNGVGEFWMIKGENSSFLMQARMAQYISNAGIPSSASVFTAFVMQQKNCHDDNVKIQVSLTLNGIQISLDGEEVAMDRESNQPKRTIMHNGASIAIYSPQQARITFRSGYSFAFTVSGSTAINMFSMASVDLKGQTKGLLGVFDGNRSNEYTCPDGVVVSPSASRPVIHNFGMQWRIDAESSLFTYPSGTTYADYQNEYFVPSFEVPNLNNVPPQAVSTCFGSVECLFDLSVTGSAEFANSTLEAFEEFNRTIEIVDLVVGICETPIPPLNGYLESVNYLVGSSVNLVCNDNLQVNGRSMLTCKTDTNGVHSWDAEFGVCSEIVNRCANKNAWLQWLCEMGFSR